MVTTNEDGGHSATIQGTVVTQKANGRFTGKPDADTRDYARTLFSRAGDE